MAKLPVPRGPLHVPLYPSSPLNTPLPEGVENRSSTNVGPYLSDPTAALEAYKAEMRKVIDGLTAVPEWTVLASDAPVDSGVPMGETRVYHHGQQVALLKSFTLYLTQAQRQLQVEAQCVYGRLCEI